MDFGDWGLPVSDKMYNTTGWEGFKRSSQDTAIKMIDVLPTTVKNLVAPLIGRIVTNVIPPHEGTYSGKDSYGVPNVAAKTDSLGDIINTVKSIIKDEPAYKVYGDDSHTLPLWRQYFGMEPKDKDNLFLRKGKDFEYNPDNPEGRSAIGKIKSQTEWYNKGQVTSPAMWDIGKFIPGIPDKWDFDLRPDQIPPKGVPYETSLFLRQLGEALTKQNAASVRTDYK